MRAILFSDTKQENGTAHRGGSPLLQHHIHASRDMIRWGNTPAITEFKMTISHRGNSINVSIANRMPFECNKWCWYDCLGCMKTCDEESMAWHVDSALRLKSSTVREADWLIMLEAIRVNGDLQILNQLLLPHHFVYETIKNTADGWRAIRSMKVISPFISTSSAQRRRD